MMTRARVRHSGTFNMSEITDRWKPFTFGEEGIIHTVRAEARGRMVGGEIVPTPWHGRYWNYEERRGMRVPFDSEVAWLLPEGEKPYWRDHTTWIDHEFVL